MINVRVDARSWVWDPFGLEAIYIAVFLKINLFSPPALGRLSKLAVT
jgi:hypothetical protein